MCIDQKMIRQQLKNAKKAKYEMGNFCEQFGLPSIAPSRKNRKKSDKFFRKKLAPYYNTYTKRKFKNIQLQIIFLKNSRNLKRKGNLNLKNTFQKANVLTTEKQVILLINALNLPKRLNKKSML